MDTDCLAPTAQPKQRLQATIILQASMKPCSCPPVTLQALWRVLLLYLALQFLPLLLPSLLRLNSLVYKHTLSLPLNGPKPPSPGSVLSSPLLPRDQGLLCQECYQQPEAPSCPLAGSMASQNMPMYGPARRWSLVVCVPPLGIAQCARNN